MGKQRNLRVKRTIEETEEGPDGEDPQPEVQREALEDIKLIQRMRKRVAGVDHKALAVTREDDGDAVETEAAVDADNELMDAFSRAQGGKTVMDEEQHMKAFVERELALRLGREVAEEGAPVLTKQQQEEQELYKLPEGLQAQLKQEVVIPGLITAITEVEVSTQDKIRKIEETEAMKRRMLANSRGGRRRAEDAEGAGPGRVSRGECVAQFGKATIRPKAEREAEEKERKRPVVISERRPYMPGGVAARAGGAKR